MSFLPKNYERPKNGNGHYLKFEDGKNTFRALSNAIAGYVYWQDEEGNVLSTPVTGCKAVHVKTLQEIPEATRKSLRQNVNMKYFLAFAVYNYAESQVQILEVTQNTIIEPMEQYILSPKWGNPKGYDFIVHKEGQGRESRYQVTVNPKEPLDEGIVKWYEDMKIDLETYFAGGDPFKQAEKEGNGTPQKAAAASR